MKPLNRGLLLHTKLRWLYYWNRRDGVRIAYSNINILEFYMIRIEPPTKIISFI